MSKFSKRLKELIVKDVDRVVSDLNFCNKSLVYNWINGNNLPNINHICALADYFKISVDYLLGRNDDYSDIVGTYPSNFKSRFNEIINSRPITKYKVFKDLHLSKGLQYAWFTKNQAPSLDNIIKIADYLCISIDYLIGRI